MPIQGLWDAAWGISREFVAALNIATMGLFWWHIDKDTEQFYERIWDLENDGEPRIRSRRMRIDWGNLVLNENDLRYTRLIVGYLLKAVHSDLQKRKALEMYLTGLALISKTDLHLGFELSAVRTFF